MSSRKTSTVGYGKKSQDWSYLTPKRAIFAQTDGIVNPDLIPDHAIIDTTVDRSGKPIERARQQTLVIYIILTEGSTLGVDAVLHLWVDGLWEEEGCANAGVPGSSSSNFGCPDVPPGSQISDQQRWCLIEAVKIANNNIPDQSIAFSFPWLPAGRYKTAIATASSITGNIIIVEQHTE